MLTLNERLQDEIISFSVQLERAKTTQTQQILGFLQELSVQLKTQIIVSDISKLAEGQAIETILASRTRQRQEALIRQATSTIAATYSAVTKVAEGQIVDIARMTNRSITNMIDDVFTVNVSEPMLTRADLKALVDTNIVQGAPAKAWWEAQDEKVQRDYAAQVRIGVAAGESTPKLITRIIGEKTGRKIEVINKKGKKELVPEYKGGVMGASRREAEALVRTSAQSISNAVLLETYKQNEDIMKGMQALATLDLRTTLLCISRDGASWSMDGEPLPESPRQEPFPGPTPWHWNCRTTLTPITKSWDDLRADAGLPRRKRLALDTVPDTERASMDGRVPGKMTFDAWLQGKKPKDQKQALGEARWELWKSGKITASQLTDFSGNPLSVAELQALAKTD